MSLRRNAHTNTTSLMEMQQLTKNLRTRLYMTHLLYTIIVSSFISPLRLWTSWRQIFENVTIVFSKTVRLHAMNIKQVFNPFFGDTCYVIFCIAYNVMQKWKKLHSLFFCLFVSHDSDFFPIWCLGETSKYIVIMENLRDSKDRGQRL